MCVYDLCVNIITRHVCKNRFYCLFGRFYVCLRFRYLGSYQHVFWHFYIIFVVVSKQLWFIVKLMDCYCHMFVLFQPSDLVVTGVGN